MCLCVCLQCKSGGDDVINHVMTSDDPHSDVDDDDDDVTAGRRGLDDEGAESDDRKLMDEDSSGPDGAGRNTHQDDHHQLDTDASDSLQLHGKVAVGQQQSGGRRKRPASDHVISSDHDHVTSSPSACDEDEEDFAPELTAADASPRVRSYSQQQQQQSEQTEIKIQRPLGLLASHGMTTKTQAVRSSSGGGSALFKHDLDQHQSSCKSAGMVHAAHQPALVGLDFSTSSLSLMHDRRFIPSPPPPAPSTPLHGACLDKTSTTTSPGAHHWTFEEQFKQVNIITLLHSMHGGRYSTYTLGGGK